MFRTVLIAFFLNAILVSTHVHAQTENKSLFEAPNIAVRSTTRELASWNQLMMHSTYFGMNFQKPTNPAWKGDPEKDLSRLATTYYHRLGPLGVVLEKFNWWPGPHNTYQADARLPASLVGLAHGSLGQVFLPVDLVAASWSEPPIGVVGMYAGTVASYARPLQHVHFFERVPIVVQLSLPKQKGKEPFFHYIKDATGRGADVRIFEGEPRPTLAGRAPQCFYQVLVVEPFKFGDLVLHEELLTKEAIAECMDKLAPDGILCYHISHRYYDLYPILADAAANLGLACVCGTDASPCEFHPTRFDNPTTHFSTEWVMLARDARTLNSLKPPSGYMGAIKKDFDAMLKDEKVPEGVWERFLKRRNYWSKPGTRGINLWTDKGPNSFQGVCRGDPRVAILQYLWYDLEEVLEKRVGAKLPAVITRAMFRGFSALHDWVADLRNRGIHSRVGS